MHTAGKTAKPHQHKHRLDSQQLPGIAAQARTFSQGLAHPHRIREAEPGGLAALKANHQGIQPTGQQQQQGQHADQGQTALPAPQRHQGEGRDGCYQGIQQHGQKGQSRRSGVLQGSRWAAQQRHPGRQVPNSAGQILAEVGGEIGHHQGLALGLEPEPMEHHPQANPIGHQAQQADTHAQHQPQDALQIQPHLQQLLAMAEHRCQQKTRTQQGGPQLDPPGELGPLGPQPSQQGLETSPQVLESLHSCWSPSRAVNACTTMVLT